MKINRLLRWVFLSGAFISGTGVTVPALASTLSRPAAPIHLCKDVFGDEDDDGDDVGDTSTPQPLCNDGLGDGDGDGNDDGDDGDDDSGDDTSKL